MESDELARRFRVKYTLGAYKISNQQDLLALKRFCDALGGQLQYVEPVQFGKDDAWFSRLLAISQGLVGTITQLVNQAESRAKHKGARSLIMKHFSEAWSNFASSNEEGLQHLGKKSRTRLINVFEVDDDEVLNMLGKLV
jgi:molybdenum cofactor biosynthesis enzyme MoaA